MGSFERPKKRIQVWKKALFHFSLCFVMGFFIGFAPSSTTSIFSNQAPRAQAISPEAVHSVERDLEARSMNRSLMSAASPVTSDEQNMSTAADTAAEDLQPELTTRRLVMVITTTKVNDPLQGVFLRRLANTLRLVPPPVLWIVVESHTEAPQTAEVLRKTGVMYRHLVFKENFTDPAAEVDHQRNVALNHIEHHHINGIVHFALLSNTYDLQFFDLLRETEVFGAWPTASVSANRKRVVLQGPVCSSSRIVGWHLQGEAGNDSATAGSGIPRSTTPKIDSSSFAFNSSILWDPERWGRPTSLPDISQDSIKFVEEVVLEDESKLKAIPPPDCSQIMMWHLHVPRRSLFFDRSIPSPSFDQNNTHTQR
uniref:Glycosyltransferases n=1 Tax=Anthurium amnicola TaxID=1678845 RepID=A0A1D1XI93_9ARAE